MQAIARLLRKKTTVTHDWIVEHINRGSRYSVQNAVKAIDSLEGTKNRTWRKQILKINNSLHPISDVGCVGSACGGPGPCPTASASR